MRLRILNFFRRILRLEDAERRPFFYLFTHAFFNGIGVSLAYAVINIIVIKKQGIEILPWLYIGTSILLILAGVFYNKLEHAYPPKTVFTFSLIFCVTWAFVMRFLLGPDKSLLFLGLAYATYYLILVLTNLDLWGSAALIFNVRQSKRLFGPLSFAESIGSIIGYGITPVLILFMPIQDVMILSGVSFLISVIVLYNLRDKYLQYEHTTEHAPNSHHSDHDHGQGFWSRLFHNNTYIKKLSILILLSTLVYYTITYGFLSRVEVHFNSIKDVAWFIGGFFSVAKILNLAIKFLAASHVFAKLGVRFGIRLLPILVIVICVIGLGFISFGVGDSIFYIFLFSSLYFFEKLFRSSLSKPSFLVLFQPLTPTLRLGGHTITKGYFEPLAMGLAGLIILVTQYFGWFSLRFLVVYVLLLSVCWLIACNQSVKQYMNELHKSLKSRLFGNDSKRLTKDEIELITSTKLNSGTEVDKLYALSLLHGQISSELETEHYEDLLKSENPDIIKESLLSLERYALPVQQEVLAPKLSSMYQEVRESAAYAIAALHQESSIDLLMEKIDEDPIKHASFIGALIKYTGLRGTLSVGHRLLDLTRSEETSDRILAIDIIDKTDNPELNALLKELIHDRDDLVAAAAIGACGSASSQELIEAVVKKVDHRHLMQPIKRCVSFNAKKSNLAINKIYPSASRSVKRRLIELSGKIVTKDSQNFLIHKIQDADPSLSSEAINSLYAQRYKSADVQTSKLLHILGLVKLGELSQLVDMYKKTESSTLLNSGLQNEIKSIYIPELLRLLSFIYSRTTIDKIMRNMTMNSQTDAANALELLENILPNKWSSQFIQHVDDMSIRTVTNGKFTSETARDLMNKISNKSIRVSDYLVAILVRTLFNYNIKPSTLFTDCAQKRESYIIQEEFDRINQ